MDIRHYDTTVEISLTPIFHADPPLITVTGFDQHRHGPLSHSQIFAFNRSCSPGAYVFTVEFSNKRDEDTVPDRGLDKAVQIDWISINGIKDQRFVWQGAYQPIYPEPWFSQQWPRPEKIIKGQSYLGWNGVWSLTIDVPAFRWIHQTQDLGWIFE